MPGETRHYVSVITGRTVDEWAALGREGRKDVIAKPTSEEEIVTLVKWAGMQRIPLVPRGKATSGYGGVLPVKGGIVVDFFRLAKLVSVDTEARTATLQPGIVWENAAIR